MQQITPSSSSSSLRARSLPESEHGIQDSEIEIATALLKKRPKLQTKKKARARRAANKRAKSKRQTAGYACHLGAKSLCRAGLSLLLCETEEEEEEEEQGEEKEMRQAEGVNMAEISISKKKPHLLWTNKPLDKQTLPAVWDGPAWLPAKKNQSQAGRACVWA